MTAYKLAMLLGLTAFWSLLFMFASWAAMASVSSVRHPNVVGACILVAGVAGAVLLASIVGLAAVATYAAIAS